MSLNRADHDKMDAISNSVPQTRVFLRPIAPPAALGLAGFAGSTWITASWIAGWWGTAESPPIFGPFVAFWGGLAQFIAGIFGFWARDTLATIIHTMWGAFWMSNGLLFFLMAGGIVPMHGLNSHTSEIGSWMVVLAAFTWSCVAAAFARDLVLCLVLTFLAIGTTIAFALFAYGNGVDIAMHVASYFWMASALVAWWRVTIFLVDEAYGDSVPKFLSPIPTPIEKRQALLAPGLGEPGVQSPKSKTPKSGFVSNGNLETNARPAQANGR